ncbi:hypothetical protein JHD50_12585 [Sulfurimonas sp. MAG313]|nr:hypothetical protein [Sulfurimonas sp. MAG313]MDF1882124.1 hypothetical protein [Sulfurimonas sp. MAG313]
MFIITKNNTNIYDRKMLLFMYVYHLVFAFVYYYMSLDGSADAYSYYYSVYDHLDEFKVTLNALNTGFIKNITYVLIKYLDLSYLNVCLLFASVGYFGFYFLYSLLFKDIDKKYLIILFFIPSMHFWSAGLGKEPLMFFALCLLTV